MNRRNMMKGMSALMVMTSFAMIASVVADKRETQQQLTDIGMHRS